MLKGCGGTTPTTLRAVPPGSTPLERTLQRRPILGQEECHGKAKEVQRGV